MMRGSQWFTGANNNLGNKKEAFEFPSLSTLNVSAAEHAGSLRTALSTLWGHLPTFHSRSNTLKIPWEVCCWRRRSWRQSVESSLQFRRRLSSLQRRNLQLRTERCESEWGRKLSMCRPVWLERHFFRVSMTPCCIHAVWDASVEDASSFTR